MVFESGFSGFSGLQMTSLVSYGGYRKCVPELIFRRCDHRIDEKNKRILSFKLHAAARTLTNNTWH
jgi:hypothetical protein